jgi:hypothetical protein
MTEAIIILMNMRGGCTTVGDKVHALFRVTSRGHRTQAVPEILESSQPSRPSPTSLKEIA